MNCRGALSSGFDKDSVDCLLGFGGKYYQRAKQDVQFFAYARGNAKVAPRSRGTWHLDLCHCWCNA